MFDDPVILIPNHRSSPIQTDIMLACAPTELPMMFDGSDADTGSSMQASWIGTLAFYSLENGSDRKPTAMRPEGKTVLKYS